MSDAGAGPGVPGAYTPGTVGAALAATARRARHAEALSAPHQQVRYTYSELDRCVDELAAVLLEAGLLAGDRVGVWSSPRAEWFVLQYAVAKIGAVVVPVDPALVDGALEQVLRECGCRSLFAASSYRAADRRGTVDALRPRVPTLEHVVYLGSPEWEQLRAAGRRAGTSALRRREAELGPGDVAAVRWTGASASSSTHADLLRGSTDAVPRRDGTDRVVIDTADAWAALTTSVAATARGACIVVPEPAPAGRPA